MNRNKSNSSQAHNDLGPFGGFFHAPIQGDFQGRMSTSRLSLAPGGSRNVGVRRPLGYGTIDQIASRSGERANV
jgi:hypothetical protein